MAEKRTRGHGYDYMILIPVMILVVLGLVFVYSASSNMAARRMGDSYYFLKRQGLFCVVGLLVMMAAKNTPAGIYGKMVYLLLFLSAGLLAALFIPGIGHAVGGARRWIRLPGVSFQPSELAKFSLAVYMAYSMSKKGSDMRLLSRGLLPHLLVAMAFVLLIGLQPDLGTAVILGCWLLVLMFVGGVNPFHLMLVMAASSPIVLWYIHHADYRLNRLRAFIHPWDDPKGIGFQIIHSFLAFGSGGILGVGPGNSKQKLFYLPEAHTDFVLSIVGEELGFAGVCLVLTLFAVLIFRGLKVSMKAPDLYSSYLALSLVCLFGLQVLVNVAVVMGLLPTKGLSLPLMSYGGSSLVFNLLAIGVLLNISSRC